MEALGNAFRARLTACLMAGSLATALGCGTPTEPAPAAPAAGVDVGRADSALDLGGYKSAGQVVCDLLNQLPGGNIGGVNINKPWCQYVNYDDLYYLGSYAWSTLILNGSPPPSKRAPAMSDALFCALKDSRGAGADGTVHTGLGRFGMASRIEVPKWDVQARQVLGQRIGTLYLFGVGLDIEDQDYVATFPTEASNSTFLRRTGYYMDLQSSKTSWGIGGNGTIPPFSLSLDFGQNGLFQSMQNNAIAFTSRDNNGNPDPTNAANKALSWDAWVASCNACTPSGVIRCDCPSQADWAQHNAFAGWNPAR
jgi:hypothetical protein